MSEPLPEDFAAALASSADRRGAFGQSVVFQSSTRSTNDIAQALAEGGAPQGAVAIAFAQTAGRGRQGREWFSPPGAGIYMSVVVRSPAVAPMLTLAGGVAVADGIRRATGLPVLIKWPNDVVVEDAHAPGRRRKLAGILAEGTTSQNGLQHVVLGIGINVRPADYPPELAARVTSLEHELGRAVDAGLVLSEILVALNEQMSALEAGVQSAGSEPLAFAGAECDREERVVERSRRHRARGDGRRGSAGSVADPNRPRHPASNLWRSELGLGRRGSRARGLGIRDSIKDSG